MLQPEERCSLLGMSPEEYRKAVKRTLIACDGRVCAAAELLGVNRSSLSRSLSHHALAGWWLAFKKKKQLERARARNRIAYLRKKERALALQGIPPDLAYELARRPAPDRSWRRRAP